MVQMSTDSGLVLPMYAPASRAASSSKTATALLKRSEDFVMGTVYLFFVVGPKPFGHMGELNHTAGKKNRTFTRGFYAGDQALMGAIGRKKWRACYG